MEAVGRQALPASIGYWLEECELSMFSIVPEESGKGSDGEETELTSASGLESGETEREAGAGVAPIEIVQPVVPADGPGAQIVALVKYMAKT